MNAWVLIAVVFMVLWGFWLLLAFVFECIDSYYQLKSSADRRSREDLSATEGTESSGF